MSAISVPLPFAARTRSGERIHFQNGRPPSTYRKPTAVSMMVFPASFTVRAYSPDGMTKVRT